MPVLSKLSPNSLDTIGYGGSVCVGANLALSYDFGNSSAPTADSQYLTTLCPNSYDPYRRSRCR